MDSFVESLSLFIEKQKEGISFDYVKDWKKIEFKHYDNSNFLTK